MSLHDRGLMLVVSGLACAWVSGCTFYTQPPMEGQCAGSAGTTPATGGSGGSGGTSGGGSSGDAGGTFEGEWVNVTTDLAGLESECGTLSYMTVKPDDGVLLAGIAALGIFASSDSGETWDLIGQGEGSDVIGNRATGFVFDPEDTNRYWESGIYRGGGLYETTDNGETFRQLGDITFADHLSIDFGDPERRTMVSGEHEAARALNRSTDGGETWTNIGADLPDDTNCTYPLVIDADVHLVGCGGYGGGPIGIYRTTDGGESWDEVAAIGGISAALRASDGTIYWASVDGGLARSDDDGESFTSVGDGAVESVTPVELPDGRIASLGNGAVVVSDDRGETWEQVSPPFPLDEALGVAYSAPAKAFFVWYHERLCSNGAMPVPDDAIQRYDFDYEER